MGFIYPTHSDVPFKTWIVNFWILSLNISDLYLLKVTEIMEIKTSNKGGLLDVAKFFPLVWEWKYVTLQCPTHKTHHAPFFILSFLFQDDCQAIPRPILKSNIRNCWVHQPVSQCRSEHLFIQNINPTVENCLINQLIAVGSLTKCCSHSLMYVETLNQLLGCYLKRNRQPQNTMLLHELSGHLPTPNKTCKYFFLVDCAPILELYSLHNSSFPL